MARFFIGQKVKVRQGVRSSNGPASYDLSGYDGTVLRINESSEGTVLRINESSRSWTVFVRMNPSRKPVWYEMWFYDEELEPFRTFKLYLNSVEI